MYKSAIFNENRGNNWWIHSAFEFVASFTSRGQILLLVTPQVPAAPTGATGTYFPFRSSIQCPTKVQECCG